MCIVHNTIGCLTNIRSRLDQNYISDFNSLDELIEFLNNYEIARKQIIAEHSKLIEEEIADLKQQIRQLEDSYSSTKDELQTQRKSRLSALYSCIDDLPETNSEIIPTVLDYWKNFTIWVKIWSVQLTFYYRLKTLDKNSKDIALAEKTRLNLLDMNFEEAVTGSCSRELRLLDLKKSIIEDIKYSIYGAYGEYKVVKTLETLTDEFILINDFNYQFHPALYNRKDDDHIKTVQVDHVLVSRAGIFIIETKNWSQQSIDNANFYSPVKQIRRANYALYMILADPRLSMSQSLNNHHWGARKIPLRNLIVLTNKRPREEFQFVKILTLSELTSYINYFPPVFTVEETQSIADYLVNISQNKMTFHRINVYH